MRYFITIEGTEREVSKEGYIRVERMAGFISQFGPDEIATASFDSGIGIAGRVEYETGT